MILIVRFPLRREGARLNRLLTDGPSAPKFVTYLPLKTLHFRPCKRCISAPDSGAAESPAVAGDATVRKTNFALRLQPALLDEVRKLAKVEGVAVNQSIDGAVAEKLSALRTDQYLAERAARGDVPAAHRILERVGVGGPASTGRPTPGDEVP